MPDPMSVIAFQQKWRAARTLKERAGYQEHFLDLCAVFGLPTPAEADPSGDSYAFEKGVAKSTGKQGFADVWRRGRFAIEYKGEHANLTAAYNQLLQYADALENPPVLITCDLDRFEIHTRFTNTPSTTHAFDIDGLSDPANLDTLRAALTNPDRLRPRTSTAAVTEEAARRFGALAVSLTGRGHAPERVAHFLMQLLFCLFAEDAGLLPKGLFTQLLAFTATQPDRFPAQVAALLAAMRSGGDVAFQPIERFNGGLFADVEPLALTGDELKGLVAASALDWGAIEPAIFGTLFERGLDPAQRAALGAHYTGRADIERVVEPVVMVPLRRRWAAVRTGADALKARWDAARSPGAATTARNAFARTLQDFQAELAAVRILDPACGSGNFLYVALSQLMGLEKEVITYAAMNGLPAPFPTVGPRQLHGIELNTYAHELAQVVVWIGFLQWRIANGFTGRRDPILDPLETIEQRDALLTRDADGTVREAAWPAADFIVGNPPFLGAKRIRAELGDDYAETLHHVFEDRLPPFSDFVCYWFEKARAQVAAGWTERVGLLATNSIRGGANRRVLDRVKQSGDIFMAWDDEPWVLNGAAVRISIVAFDDGSETERTLDGAPAEEINADLTGSLAVSSARRLNQNAGVCFLGVQFSGPFDMDGESARRMLALPMNPNDRPNADVVRPVANGLDLTRRPRDQWVVDFGVDTTFEAAALYEAPFAFLDTHVRPKRAAGRSQLRDTRWWLPVWTRPEMRQRVLTLSRYLATPTVSKFRVFAWLNPVTLPNHALVVFARDDDYFFGVLHSRAHEVWSLRMGTSLEDRPRYTPTTCFETFPLPWPPGHEPAGREPGAPADPRHTAVADAARALDTLRRAWLDPAGADEAELRKRTLTNLYNARPTWLANAHAALDRAVWAAYGWPAGEAPADTPDDTILARLLALNAERAGGS